MKKTHSTSNIQMGQPADNAEKGGRGPWQIRLQYIKPFVVWMRKRNLLSHVAYGMYVMLHIISCITTTVGLATVMGSDSTALGWVLPVAISLVCQGAIGSSGHVLRNCLPQRKWLRGLAAGCVLCIGTSVSVGFAYGFWWHLLSAEDLAAEVAASEIQSVIEPAEEYSFQLSESASKLEQLESYSASRAEVEAKDGFTCENIGGERGPRFRLRQKDKEMFQTLASGVRRNAGKVREQVNELRALQYAPTSHDQYKAGINQLLSQMRPIVLADQRPLIGQLSDRIELGRGEIIDDLSPLIAPLTFHCSDTLLEDLLEVAIASLKNLPEIAANVPAALNFHSPDRKTSVNIAYQELANLTGVAVSTEGRALPEGDWVPLVLAVFVDGLILLIPWVFGGSASQSYGNESPGSRPHSILSHLDAALEFDSKRPRPSSRQVVDFALGPRSADPTLLHVFEPYVVESAKFDLVIMPLGISNPKIKALQNVLRVLNWRPYIRRCKVTPFLRRNLQFGGLALANAKYASIYRIESGMLPVLMLEDFRDSLSPQPTDDD